MTRSFPVNGGASGIASRIAFNAKTALPQSSDGEGGRIATSVVAKYLPFYVACYNTCRYYLQR